MNVMNILKSMCVVTGLFCIVFGIVQTIYPWLVVGTSKKYTLDSVKNYTKLNCVGMIMLGISMIIRVLMPVLAASGVGTAFDMVCMFVLLLSVGTLRKKQEAMYKGL